MSPFFSKPFEEVESNHNAYFPNHFGVLSEKGLSIRISPVEPWTQQTMTSNRSKVDVPFSLLAAQQLSSIFSYHKSDPHKWKREDDGSSSRERLIQNLYRLIRIAESRSMSYARIAANSLQWKSSRAHSEFRKFFKLAGVWCIKKLYWPSTLRWQEKSHEDLWEMANSVMQLEIEARRSSRALCQLEHQILASERWITLLQAWLSKKSYVEKRLKIKKVISRLEIKKVITRLKMKKGTQRLKIKKVISRLKRKKLISRLKIKKVIPRVRAKPVRRSNSRTLSLWNKVYKDELADKAWDLVNKNHLRLAKKPTRNRNQSMLAEENRAIADEVAKLLDGFRP